MNDSKNGHDIVSEPDDGDINFLAFIALVDGNSSESDFFLNLVLKIFRYLNSMTGLKIEKIYTL